MKSLHELRLLFHSKMINELKPLEEERRKIAKKLTIAGLVVGSVVLPIVLVILIGRYDNAVVLWPLIVGAMAWGGLYMWWTAAFRKSFKKKVIERIIKFIDPNLLYSPHRHISRLVYMGSKIFTRRPDRYKGDDLVEGTLDKTNVAFSEIHSEYETRDSKGRRSYHTIFKGLLFVADFNKHFQGTTIVLPDTAEKLFGGLGTMFQSWNRGRGELIKLEDPDFEKLFVVYGEDQIEARYILSTSLMKRMSDFKQKTRKTIYFSFVGSKIYVAISYFKDLFEPKIFKTLLRFDEIKEYYEDLQLALDIVDDLNLNTRIWTKR